VSVVEPLNRTLEQELNALLRGASLECLVCGEFVLRRHGSILCPECGSGLGSVAGKAAGSRLQLGSQAG
jgi:Zn finger protein HypA/HybF involved in hydrogenase expression